MKKHLFFYALFFISITCFSQTRSGLRNNIDLKATYSSGQWMPDIAVPNLTKQNAYIKFTSGYRAWVIINERPNNNLISDFNTDTIRKYLPNAQQFFQKNPTSEKLLIQYSDSIKIVIQRPNSDENLKKEIAFPNYEQEEKDFEKRWNERIQKSLIISPNPASRILQVYFEYNILITKVEITTTKGVNLLTNELSEPALKVEINISELSEGLHTLTVTDFRSRKFSKQFLKE